MLREQEKRRFDLNVKEDGGGDGSAWLARCCGDVVGYEGCSPRSSAPWLLPLTLKAGLCHPKQRSGLEALPRTSLDDAINSAAA